MALNLLFVLNVAWLGSEARKLEWKNALWLAEEVLLDRRQDRVLPRIDGALFGEFRVDEEAVPDRKMLVTELFIRTIHGVSDPQQVWLVVAKPRSEQIADR